MGEKIGEFKIDSKTAERRVFGNAFSFNNGPADDYTQGVFFAERHQTIIIDRGDGWIPGILDNRDDSGVVAYLYKKGQIVACISTDFDGLVTDVYVSNSDPQNPERLLCNNIPFEEAVIATEKLLENE